MKYKYYKAYMACRDGKTRTVTITTDATDNTSTKMLTLTGCTIEMDSDEDVFTPVRTKRGKLSIQCNDSDLSISDLMPTSLTSHAITITRNGATEFIGYITAESSSQSYPNEGNDFDLQFVSRLGIADSVMFWPYTANGDLFPTSRCPFINILSYIFTSCGFGNQDDLILPMVVDPWKEVRTSGEFNCWSELTTGLYQFAHVEDTQDNKTHYHGIADKNYATKSMLDVLTGIAKFFCVSFHEESYAIVALSPEETTFKKCSVVDQDEDPWHSTFTFADEPYVENDDIYGIITEGTASYFNAAKKSVVELAIDTDESFIETDISKCEFSQTYTAPLFNNDSHKIDVMQNESSDGLMEVYGQPIIYSGRTTLNGGIFARLQLGSGRDYPLDEGIFWGGYQITTKTSNIVKFTPKAYIPADNAFPTTYEITFDVVCGSVIETDFQDDLPTCEFRVSMNNHTYIAELDSVSNHTMKMKVETGLENKIESGINLLMAGKTVELIDGSTTVIGGADELANYVFIISNIEITTPRERENADCRNYIYNNSSEGEEYEHNSDLGCWSQTIANYPINIVYYKTNQGAQGGWQWGYIFNDIFTGEYHTEYDYSDPQHPLPYDVYDMEDYGDHLVKRINKQKGTKYHCLELGVEISSLITEKMVNAINYESSTYQITGFSRDYMTGIDKVKLTSIQQ